MEKRTIQLRVGGQVYRVSTNAEPEEVHRLAGQVEAKIAEVSRGRAVTPQALLLAAISLAHDLEEERGKRESLERRTRDLLRRVLMRIDDAIEDAPPA